MFTRAFLTDLAERVVATWGEAAIGIYLAAPHVGLDVTQAKAAAIAALPAALAVLKGVIATRVGDRSPALLPKHRA